MIGALVFRRVYKTFRSLTSILYIWLILGFINVPLLNPAPTKKEYFWLWTLIILENIVALTIEVRILWFIFAHNILMKKIKNL